MLHHYVPNTNLKSSSFNETYQQFQVIQHPGLRRHTG